MSDKSDMNNSGNDPLLKNIHKELKKIRTESWIKDLLIATVPLFVAALSIYFSNLTIERQLEHSRGIESAKIIENFSSKIAQGGEEAQLAQIAFESVPLTGHQRNQLAYFFEKKAGGTDEHEVEKQPPPPPGSTSIIDTDFEELLGRLFDTEREVRSKAYSDTRKYLAAKQQPSLIKQMFSMAGITDLSPVRR